MLTPQQIKEYAFSLASGSKVLARSWRAFMITSVMLTWGGILSLIFLVIWEGRDALAKQIYTKLSTDEGTLTPALDPWSMVPVEEFPEFWKCEEQRCIPDEAKRAAVNDILLQLKNDLQAVRVVYSVYGFSYRRVVAQATALGEYPLGQEMWITPLNQPGIAENIRLHEKGLCSSVQISKLPEGSLLRVEAPIQNTSFIKNCPTDKKDIAYYLQGYLSADFDENADADLPEVERQMREAAEEIEEIMGFDEQKLKPD